MGWRSRRRGKSRLRQDKKISQAVVEALEQRRLLSGVSFALGSTLPVGNQPSAIAAADLRKDGRTDLVVASSNNNSIEVLLNNGNGTFQPAQGYTALGQETDILQVLDVNHDGIPDIVASDNSNGIVSVFLGKGDGTFLPPVETVTTPYSSVIDVADFNGDGKPDLLVNYNNISIGTGGAYSNTLQLLPGLGNGKFGPPATVYNLGGQLAVFGSGDINSDGHTDLLLGVGHTLSDLISNNNGTFQKEKTLFTFSQPIGDIQVLDVNGDGKADIILSTQSGYGFPQSSSSGPISLTGIDVLEGNGNGTFKSPIVDSAATAPGVTDGILGEPVVLVGADFTGDGLPDLIVLPAYGDAETSSTVGVVLNTGNGTFGSINYTPTGNDPDFAVAADFNGDGKPDIATVNYKDGTVSILLNTSANTGPAPKVTTTTLTSSPDPGTVGHVVTLTATVTAASGSPSGEVTFVDGSTTLGTEPINSSTHKATYTTSGLALGVNSLTADFSGSGGFAASTSMAFTETINAAPAARTAIALTSSPNPAAGGQIVTLTATVTSTTGWPGGAVTFLEGAATLDVASINTATHKATFTTSALAIGTNSLTAVYTGTSGFAASTSTVLKEYVTGPKTTTILASSLNPGTVGQVVTLTATVTSTSGSPGGFISFVDGTKTLGTEPVNTITQIATFTTSTLPAGSNSLIAAYTGMNGFASSVSAAVKETINPIPPAKTMTTLSPSENPATVGDDVTFTATVTAAAGSPGGTVTFKDGSKTLGTAPLDTGTSQAVFSTTTLAAGAHSITASYAGAGGYASSVSPAVGLTVNKLNTATSSTLKLVSTDLPGKAPIQQNITVDDTIKNNGPANLPDTELDYFISALNQLGPNAVQIGSRDLGPLNSGQESEGETDLITGDIVVIGGQRYYILLTDPENNPDQVIASRSIVFD